MSGRKPGRAKKNQTPKCWPTAEDFPEEEFPATLKWRELPLGVWEIVNKKIVTTCNGPALVLTVQCEAEVPRDVWPPERLKDKLQENPEVKFILHKGLVPSKRHPDRKYFDFSLK